MSGSALPGLIDALVAGTTTALPAVNVSDGLPMTSASGDYLAVGVDDYDGDRIKAAAGNSIEAWANASGLAIDESGSITCVAWSQNGNRDLKAARDAVYAIHGQLRTWLRGQLTGGPNALGVAGVWDVRVAAVDELNQAQDANGATAIIRFSIAYQARI